MSQINGLGLSLTANSAVRDMQTEANSGQEVSVTAGMRTLETHTNGLTGMDGIHTLHPV